MRGRYKSWAAPYIEEHPDLITTSLIKDDPFLDNSPLYLEIGAGKGGFAISYHKTFKGAYLAIERDTSVAATFAKRLEVEEISGIKIINQDFDLLFEDLPKATFDKIFVNFPDPWPKKRHEKRRLVVKSRLAKMSELLKKGGCLYFKTDSEPLYQFALENIPYEIYDLISNEGDYNFRGDDDAMSEYETRFRELGKKIARVILKKK